MQTYIVQEGDTLCGIAKQFNTNIYNIKKANNLTGNEITPGQSLLIPTYNSTTYTVKKGDNLYDIARKYNLSISQLLDSNNLASDALQIGQILVIPLNNQSNDKDYFNYIVKKGDNLYDIAKRYNTTVDDIKQLNNLTSNNLKIGQNLIIMANNTGDTNNVSQKEYVVQGGDTIYSIASKFNMPVNNLVSLNNLKSNILTVGQTLIIDEDSYNLPNQIKECYGTNYKPPEYQTYTVKSGDNLYNIANLYQTTADNIMALNNLSSPNLDIGQILKIKEIS